MSLDTNANFDPYYKWLGIPSVEQPANYYRLLGVVLFEPDADVIAAAADRQMAHVKSFAMGRYASESQRLLNELARARVCLLNVERKADYDERLRREQRPKENLTSPSAIPPQPPPPASLAASPPSLPPPSASEMSATEFSGTPSIRVRPRRAWRRRRPSPLGMLLWIVALGACLIGALMLLVQVSSGG